jgi:hypothetical protein
MLSASLPKINSIIFNKWNNIKAYLVNIRRPVIFAFLQKFRAAFSFFAEMPDFPAEHVFLRIFR